MSHVSCQYHSIADMRPSPQVSPNCRTVCYSLPMLSNSVTKRLCANNLALSLVPLTIRAMGESITTITNTAA
jgi:hypothetical protein